MDNQDEHKKIEVIDESYIQVSESRIKNTIKEYKKGQPFGWILSSSFACMVSFLPPTPPALLTIIYGSGFFCACYSVLPYFYCVWNHYFSEEKSWARNWKWFLEEIRNSHPYKAQRRSVNSKIVFYIVNFILIIGVPLTVLLVTLGCNGWNISGKEWSRYFWLLWIIGTLCSLVFGTFINAYFAYLLFGFEDGFPDIPLL